MKILGLGVDLSDIDRVEGVLDRYPRFAERCFTEHEREYASREYSALDPEGIGWDSKGIEFLRDDVAADTEMGTGTGG